MAISIGLIGFDLEVRLARDAEGRHCVVGVATSMAELSDISILKYCERCGSRNTLHIQLSYPEAPAQCLNQPIQPDLASSGNVK
jgi:hypothetical protein